MLIIPTSTDTALILQTPQSGLVSVGAYAVLACGAFCLWEMLMSSLRGRKPSVSRWVWLGVSGLLFVSGAALSEFTLGTVTFNDGEITTAWGFVLGAWCLTLMIPCVLITLSLRAIDAARVHASGRMPYLAWWVLGVVVMTAYGLRLGWEAGPAGAVRSSVTTSDAVGPLAIAAMGSLVAVAAVRLMRGEAAHPSQ